MVTFFKLSAGAGKVNRYLNQAANAMAVMVIFIMMFHITADVFGRYLFSQPIPGTYEISEMLMVLVVFLGLAYTQAEGSHIRVETMVRFLPPRGRLIAEILTHFVFLTIFAFFIWEGSRQGIISWQEREFVAGLINIPRYPARWAIPVGAFLVCLQLMFDIAGRFRELRSVKGESR